jgi:hypothetical protein
MKEPISINLKYRLVIRAIKNNDDQFFSYDYLRYPTEEEIELILNTLDYDNAQVKIYKVTEKLIEKKKVLRKELDES